MPLASESLQSVVRLTSSGDFVGTAFIVSVPSESIRGKWWPYVLTADHVVHNEIQSEIAIEIPDPHPDHVGKLSEPVPIRFRQPLPGIDLAIAPYPDEGNRRFMATRMDGAVPPGAQPLLGAIVYYVGMFMIDPPVPMARAANVGAIDVLQTKTYATHTYRYPAHLIDCRSYKGYSGSPCFVQTLYADLNRVPDVSIGDDSDLRSLAYTSLLAGMFTAHYTDEGAPDNPDDLVGRYGVGVMLSSDYIWEALMTDEARQERREWDQQLAAAKAARVPPLRDASARPHNEEWDRFEALTQQLVNTPKQQG